MTATARWSAQLSDGGTAVSRIARTPSHVAVGVVLGCHDVTASPGHSAVVHDGAADAMVGTACRQGVQRYGYKRLRPSRARHRSADERHWWLRRSAAQPDEGGHGRGRRRRRWAAENSQRGCGPGLRHDGERTPRRRRPGEQALEATRAARRASPNITGTMGCELGRQVEAGRRHAVAEPGGGRVHGGRGGRPTTRAGPAPRATPDDRRATELENRSRALLGAFRRSRRAPRSRPTTHRRAPCRECRSRCRPGRDAEQLGRARPVGPTKPTAWSRRPRGRRSGRRVADLVERAR